MIRSSLIDRACRSLERLRQTLDHLVDRLREEIGRAVGATIGTAVQEALRTILGDLPNRTVPTDLPAPSGRSPPRWRDPNDGWPAGEYEPDWSADYEGDRWPE